MASAGRDALTECREIIKRACTYRARADGCGAGAGRVATTGRAPRDDGSVLRDDGYAARNDGSAAREDGSTACDDRSASRDDEYGSLKKIRRRRVRNVRRQIQGRATTAAIARQRVTGRATTGRGLGDNGSDPVRMSRGHSI